MLLQSNKIQFASSFLTGDYKQWENNSESLKEQIKENFRKSEKNCRLLKLQMETMLELWKIKLRKFQENQKTRMEKKIVKNSRILEGHIVTDPIENGINELKQQVAALQ